MRKAEGIADVPALSPGRKANVIFGRPRQAIKTGICASGGQLPAERRVALTFGAARPTVRKALDQLAKMKLVTGLHQTRRAGSRTFVNYPKPEDEDVAALKAHFSVSRPASPLNPT